MLETIGSISMTEIIIILLNNLFLLLIALQVMYDVCLRKDVLKHPVPES